MSARRGGDMARTVTLPTLAHSSSNCWWYFLANLMNSRLPTSSPNLSRFWLTQGLILTAVGHHCMPQGRLPDVTRIDKITNWGPCKTLSNVWAFLGTVGMCHIFIPNFSWCANPLVQLTCKDVPFTFGPAQIAAQDDLKKVLLESPALQPIDYSSDSPVILAVDTSQITVGFYICQADPDNLCK